VNVPEPIVRAIARVVGWPPIAIARRIVDRYNAAGGGLVAGGLTYSALFALLPALLLLTGILGFVVDDADRRRAIVESIGESVPPLRGLLDASLEQITDGAAGAGTLGLLALAWGASRFYGSLDEAFARVFEGTTRRGLIADTLRGLVSVVLLISVFLAALILTGIASFLAEETASRFRSDTRTFWSIVTPLLTLVLFVAGMAVVYRVVPARSVPWGAVRLPAAAVGGALTALTQAFSYIAPRLIGAAAVYGTFVAIFATMVWLSLGFQLMLLGGAWVRERLGPVQPSTVAGPPP
jgi:membrane protein